MSTFLGGSTESEHWAGHLSASFDWAADSWPKVSGGQVIGRSGISWYSRQYRNGNLNGFADAWEQTHQGLTSESDHTVIKTLVWLVKM